MKKSTYAGHQLTFGPHGDVAIPADVKTCQGPTVNTVDFTCPACGLRLYVYYRAELPSKGRKTQ
jgi:DNA-directed RNA polymerase subunit M/transcription elongation factor TFIIS